MSPRQTQNLSSIPALARPLQSSRLLSLDVLRGLTVALMILVNNASDGDVSYAQMRHSVWNGCTLTDLIFPTFLYIVGASIVLAFDARIDRGHRAARFCCKSSNARRSLPRLGSC